MNYFEFHKRCKEIKGLSLPEYMLLSEQELNSLRADKLYYKNNIILLPITIITWFIILFSLILYLKG